MALLNKCFQTLFHVIANLYIFKEFAAQGGTPVSSGLLVELFGGVACWFFVFLSYCPRVPHAIALNHFSHHFSFQSILYSHSLLETYDLQGLQDPPDGILPEHTEACQDRDLCVCDAPPPPSSCVTQGARARARFLLLHLAFPHLPRLFVPT